MAPISAVERHRAFPLTTEPRCGRSQGTWNLIIKPGAQGQAVLSSARPDRHLHWYMARASPLVQGLAVCMQPHGIRRAQPSLPVQRGTGA